MDLSSGIILSVDTWVCTKIELLPVVKSLKNGVLEDFLQSPLKLCDARKEAHVFIGGLKGLVDDCIALSADVCAAVNDGFDEVCVGMTKDAIGANGPTKGRNKGDLAILGEGSPNDDCVCKRVLLKSVCGCCKP